MSEDPIILTANPGSQHFAFFRLTFGLSDYMLYDEAFPIQGNFEKAKFDKSAYDEVRILFDRELPAVVPFSKLTIIIQIVDFIGKALLNDIVDERLGRIFKRDFPDNEDGYDNSKAFFFTGATAFFAELKENFSNRPDVLASIRRLVTWKGWE